jgi:hypothetical protein
MNTRLLVAIAASLVLSLPIARADDETDLNRTADSINQHSATPEGERDVLRSIAAETHVPPSTLLAQKNATGYGNGELLIANLLARASDRTFEDIVAMRKTEGWGKLAHDLGLNLGQIVSRAHRAEQAAEHARNGGRAHQFDGQPGHGHAHGHGRP